LRGEVSATTTIMADAGASHPRAGGDRGPTVT
jgi:hypothetical protein